MQRTILTIVIGAISALAVAPAGAVDLPPGRWWENERLVRHLQLTSEQQQSIQDLVYDHAQRMIDLNAAVERTKLDLERTTKAERLDVDATRAAFAAFQQARTNLERERFEMLLAVRQILTDAQWQELLSLRERLENLRRHRQDGRPLSGGPPSRPQPRERRF